MLPTNVKPCRFPLPSPAPKQPGRAWTGGTNPGPRGHRGGPTASPRDPSPREECGGGCCVSACLSAHPRRPAFPPSPSSRSCDCTMCVKRTRVMLGSSGGRGRRAPYRIPYPHCVHVDRYNKSSMKVRVGVTHSPDRVNIESPASEYRPCTCRPSATARTRRRAARWCRKHRCLWNVTARSVHRSPSLPLLSTTHLPAMSALDRTPTGVWWVVSAPARATTSYI